MIEELIKKRIVQIAKQPPKNGRDFDGLHLTIPLLAEDYPAKTAIMWNTAYRSFKIPDQNVMLVAEPKNISEILQVFRKDDRYIGGGVGIGFKEVILPHLDHVIPLARAIGAVNVIKKVNGKLIGYNTDGEGYAKSLEEHLAHLSPRAVRILMLGAGGSGRAIAFALAERGMHLTILNRTKEKAIELAETVNNHFGVQIARGEGRDLIPAFVPGADAIVSVIDDAKSPLDQYSTIGEMNPVISDASIEKAAAIKKTQTK